MNKKEYKVGDRIFAESWNNHEIFDCIVTKVEPRTTRAYNGNIINYNMLYTGSHSAIEDYNCLDEDDPKVIEYKKNHADPRDFIEKFNKFIKDNHYDLKSHAIQEYLYDLIK